MSMFNRFGAGGRIRTGLSGLSGLAAAVLLAVSVAGCAAGAERGGGGPAEDARPGAEMNPTGMPILNEPYSLTFFTGSALSNRYEDTLVWRKYADMTNISVRFELVPFDALAAKRNLALSDESYPDVFYSARLSPKELDTYGRQGVLIRLDDLIERYAPNFSKLMEQYPNIRKGLTMSDGHIYSLPSFYDPDLLSMLIGLPLWVNNSWLDKLGMAEPTTIGQFYDYLKAVKNTDLNGNGIHDEIPFADNGITDLINQLKGAWGLGTRGLGHPFVDVAPDSGELRFTRIQPGYKELIQFLHKLYEEGLLDKEIFTLDYDALLAKGKAGLLGSTIVPSPETLMNRKEYIGLGALEGPHGDRMYSHIKVPMVHPGAFAITSKNPIPEATMRWIDYFYGEEGATFFFMGEEGVTYEKSENGEMRYVSDITDNSEGLTHDQALAKYVTWIGGSYPGFVRAEYFKGSETLPKSMAVAEKAKPYAVPEIWYNFNLNEEEQRMMSSVGADIQSYVTEMEEKFISGDTPLAYWDQYVLDIEQRGLEPYMAVYQAAYERYRK